MQSDFVPVNIPDINLDDVKAVTEVVESGWVSSTGKYINSFEENFSSYIGAKYGAAVSNGTGALDIAVQAIGLEKDDEVIVPGFTIISPINAIIRSGAKPVLVDVSIDNYNVEVSEIEKLITEKTKAILIVHLYGLCTDMIALRYLCDERNLILIEDAAEVHGLVQQGKKIGSFGDISTFSFFANKIITCGEGGMVLTSSRHLFERIKEIRNLCFKDDLPRFVHQEIGYNYRMTSMQAALGNSQLSRIDDFLNHRKALVDIYKKHLSKFACIHFMPSEFNGIINVNWVFPILLNETIKLNSSQLRDLLLGKGIDSRSFFCPMNFQPVFKSEGLFQETYLPNSERLWHRGLYLPLGNGLSFAQIEKSARILAHILEQREYY